MRGERRAYIYVYYQKARDGNWHKMGDKIIEASGVLRRVWKVLPCVMGGIAGGEGKVEKMEEVVSL